MKKKQDAKIGIIVENIKEESLSYAMDLNFTIHMKNLFGIRKSNDEFSEVGQDIRDIIFT